MNKRGLILFLILFVIVGVQKISALEISDDIVSQEEYVEDTKYFKIVTLVDDVSSISTYSNRSSFITEISEEEFYNPSNNIDETSIITSTYKLTAKISKYGNYYRYYAIATWSSLPSVDNRSYDTIGLSFYQSVTPLVSFDFEQFYCINGGSCTTQTNGYREYNVAGAVAATYYLPSGELTALKQTIDVIVTKVDTSGTVVSQYAVASYGHADRSVTFTQAKAFSLNLTGLHYDSTASGSYTTARVGTTWQGTW